MFPYTELQKQDPQIYNAIRKEEQRQLNELELIASENHVSIPVLEKHNAGNGNVHYEHEGARLQGIRVAEVISEQLGITTNECPSTKEIISQLKQYEGKI